MHTVGAVLDGGMLHPGRTGRNHLRALGQGRRGSATRASTSCWSSSRSRTPANRRAGGYSLGMRQRLGLAAALLGDPKVLVLDEPANGLDPQGIRWLRDFLRGLAAEGRAILVSSHVLAEVAQTADDVVVIDTRPLGRAGAAGRDHGPQRRRDAASRGPDVAQPRRPPRRARARRSPATAREILVHDRSGEQIGRLVAEHQLVISELSPVGRVAGGDLLRAHRRAGRAVVMRLISAELFKLRTTRTFYALAGGALGLMLLI